MRAPDLSVADQPFRIDRADAVRWIGCFAVVVAAHGMAALTLLPSLAAFGWARASMSSVSSSRTCALPRRFRRLKKFSSKPRATTRKTPRRRE